MYDQQSPGKQHQLTTTLLVPATRIRKRRNIAKWLARGLLSILLLLGVTFATIPSGRALVRTALLMPTIWGTPQRVPLSAIADSFNHTTVQLEPDRGGALLDIYAPASSAHFVPDGRQALFVIPGLGDHRHDTSLQNIATTLARTGTIVVLVTTSDLLNNHLNPDDTANLLGAFDYVQQRIPGINPANVGIIAVGLTSVFAIGIDALPHIKGATLPATIPVPATLNVHHWQLQSPPIFICLLNGVGSVMDVIRFFAEGNQPDDDTAKPALANMLSHYLPSEDMQVWQDAFAHHAGMISDKQLAMLTSQTRAAYHLLAGDQPEQVNTNLAQLPDALGSAFQTLSAEYYAQYLHPIVLPVSHPVPHPVKPVPPPPDFWQWKYSGRTTTFYMLTTSTPRVGTAAFFGENLTIALQQSNASIDAINLATAKKPRSWGTDIITMLAIARGLA
jgi:hypothetical protein